MDAQGLGLVEAADSATADIAPLSAAVNITLTGDKFFSGEAAFSKAEELRRLAEALEKRGIPKSALSLSGVTADVSSGVFTKSSSVTYRVRVLVEDLELLGSVLDVISEAKKALLTRLDWIYDDHGAEERALLRQAGERAAAKARVLAESVGGKLGALHSVREERSSGARRQVEHGDLSAAPAPAPARARSVADELRGLELAPKRPVTVRVAVAYLIDSAAAEGA